MKGMADRQKRVVEPKEQKPRDVVNVKKLNQNVKRKGLTRILREQISKKERLREQS